MIDVLVVDDHKVFRAGLKRLISDETDIRVTDEAADGATALGKIRSGGYDVVLLDINMTGRNGLDVLQSIRRERPAIPVVMLSMYPEEQYAIVALRAHANAYLSKDAEPHELIAAIRQVAGGGQYLTSRAAARVLSQLSEKEAASPHAALLPREMQIFTRIVAGVSLTDIGHEMSLSVKTIGTYRSRILSKLGMASNAELVQYAMRYGLVC
ncbi:MULTISPECIES: response regulator transcription factor [unclassified Burkholderia]|uniref:response regulator n=1 Tax=unclassified Burkholderia TaxID=2613784 RepID=UPI000F5770FF|nr:MULTISPECIES: response regulator transcription factor [unclassified Burkholderia]RQR30148.1 DNA-binding response regulator [Burkholderia sp. Bp9142]RQR50030.1 DNA-binding response regulator [Burkholderia sp. Bp9140]